MEVFEFFIRIKSLTSIGNAGHPLFSIEEVFKSANACTGTIVDGSSRANIIGVDILTG